ncbi:MAG: CDP-diacylglycerol--serine O-phosphatidyltransferase [Polyangiales bacterium]
MKFKQCLPSLVTLGNIAFGFLGILAAADGHFQRACVLLFCGALCDLFDGRLARLLRATTQFGAELDSLSDMVTFGLAPAVLVYFAVLRPLGAVGVAAVVAFALAAAVRLARYNVDESPLADLTFHGVPTPIAAGYLLSCVLVREQISKWTVLTIVVGISLTMLSTLKVPKFRKGNLPGLLLYPVIAAFVGLLVHPSALTWHLWNGWNLALVAMNYAFLARRTAVGSEDEDKLRLAA